MAKLTVAWSDGNGHISVDINTSTGVASISSDTQNDSVARQQTITFTTTKGSPVCKVQRTVVQAGTRYGIKDSANVLLRDKNGLILTAKK